MTTSPPNTSTLQQSQMTMPQGNIDFGTKFTCKFCLNFEFPKSALSSVCIIADIFSSSDTIQCSSAVHTESIRVALHATAHGPAQ